MQTLAWPLRTATHQPQKSAVTAGLFRGSTAPASSHLAILVAGGCRNTSGMGYRANLNIA
jgi:hypothetical protein